ncbi:hypothetical protein FAIPA1_440027 [Frankia sp. AiPs1]
MTATRQHEKRSSHPHDPSSRRDQAIPPAHSSDQVHFRPCSRPRARLTDQRTESETFDRIRTALFVGKRLPPRMLGGDRRPARLGGAASFAASEHHLSSVAAPASAAEISFPEEGSSSARARKRILKGHLSYFPAEAWNSTRTVIEKAASSTPGASFEAFDRAARHRPRSPSRRPTARTGPAPTDEAGQRTRAGREAIGPATSPRHPTPRQPPRPLPKRRGQASGRRPCHPHPPTETLPKTYLVLNLVVHLTIVIDNVYCTRPVPRSAGSREEREGKTRRSATGTARTDDPRPQRRRLGQARRPRRSTVGTPAPGSNPRGG